MFTRNNNANVIIWYVRWVCSSIRASNLMSRINRCMLRLFRHDKRQFWYWRQINLNVQREQKMFSLYLKSLSLSLSLSSQFESNEFKINRILLIYYTTYEYCIASKYCECVCTTDCAWLCWWILLCISLLQV